jgi:hypothetical protein
MKRALLVAVTLFVVAGGVAAVAVADHRHKNARMRPANIASWYCQHRGERCDEPQAEDVEAAWQDREQLYRAGFYTVSLGAIGAAAVALTLGIRSKRRSFARRD